MAGSGLRRGCRVPNGASNSTAAKDYGRLTRSLSQGAAVMGKYLLLLAGVLIVYWIIRSSLRRRNLAARKDKSAPDQDMVRCAQCGIHLPRGESLTVRGQFYCCADHQRSHDPGS